MQAARPAAAYDHSMRPTAVLAIAAALCAAPAACGPAEPPPVRRSPRSALPLQAVDGRLDLGTLAPCLGEVRRTVRVANRSGEPVQALAWASNCPCLEAELLGNPLIGPGEEREVALVLDPTAPGERSMVVDIAGQAGSVGVVEVAFVAVPVPACTPAEVTVPAAGDLAIDVAVALSDGGPVEVLSVDPPLATASAGPDGRWRLAVSPAEARRLAAAPGALPDAAVERAADGRVDAVRVTVRTADPVCPEAVLRVNLAR